MLPSVDSRKEDHSYLSCDRLISPVDVRGNTNLLPAEQLKKDLKVWEKSFMISNGRPPTKQDAASNSDIAKKYKLYYKYRKQEVNDANSRAASFSSDSLKDHTSTSLNIRSKASPKATSMPNFKREAVVHNTTPKKRMRSCGERGGSPGRPFSRAALSHLVENGQLSDEDEVGPSPVKCTDGVFGSGICNSRFSSRQTACPLSPSEKRKSRLRNLTGRERSYSPEDVFRADKCNDNHLDTRPQDKTNPEDRAESLFTLSVASRNDGFKAQPKGLTEKFSKANATKTTNLLPHATKRSSITPMKRGETVPIIASAVKEHGLDLSQHSNLKFGFDAELEDELEFCIADSATTSVSLAFLQSQSQTSQHSDEEDIIPANFLHKKHTLARSFSSLKLKNIGMHSGVCIESPSEETRLRDDLSLPGRSARDEEILRNGHVEGKSTTISRSISDGEDDGYVDDEILASFQMSESDEKVVEEALPEKRRIQKRTTRKTKIAPHAPLERSKSAFPASKPPETVAARKKSPSKGAITWKNAHRPMQAGGEDGWGFVPNKRSTRSRGSGANAGGCIPTANVGKQASQNFVALKLQKGYKRGSRVFVNHGWKGNGYSSTPMETRGSSYGSYTKNAASNLDAETKDAPDADTDPPTSVSSLPKVPNSATVALPPVSSFVEMIEETEARGDLCPAQSQEKTLCMKHSPFRAQFEKAADGDACKLYNIDLPTLLKTYWGFDNFRDGQLRAITRILHGQSTLLILPTGAGKSLCYQLPTLILSDMVGPMLTLVVSPMISLMEDQVKSLPECLPGASITSNQTTAEYNTLVGKLYRNEIKILFVSPEKLQSTAFVSLLQSPDMPPVKFACVDEVHCLSEWSHNFRPSYLLLNNILKNILKVPCALGLTGTATLDTKKSICSMLDIDMSTVICGGVTRPNLRLSVSNDPDRDKALLHLLNTRLFKSLDSIIIYVMRQADAERVASFLRVRGLTADSYHAGKALQDRETTQANFMSGRLRILVATIAFGLGLNKRDVRSVIHYSLPKSLESYVQEIGRSGRDGLPAYCHLFLNQDDYLRLRSLSYGNGVNDLAIGWLLHQLFALPEELSKVHDGKKPRSKKKDEAHSPIVRPNSSRIKLLCVEQLETNLDMKQEVIATLLSYLELEKEKPVINHPPIFASCSVTFIKTPASKLADDSPLIEELIKVSRKVRNTYTFDTTKLGDATNLSFPEIQYQLGQLKRKKEVLYEFREQSYRVEILRECMDSDGDEYLDHLKRHLSEKAKTLEESNVMKVDVVYNLMKRAASNDVTMAYPEDLGSLEDAPKPADGVSVKVPLQEKVHQDEQSQLLQDGIVEYFLEETKKSGASQNHSSIDATDTLQYGMIDPSVTKLQKQLKPLVEADVTTFVKQNATAIKNGKAVARIFHGMQSPKVSALDWYRNPFWKKHINFDFAELASIAQAALTTFKLAQSLAPL